MEQYELQEEKFDIDVKNEDLVATFKRWHKESQTYHDEILKKQKISEQYYLGNQTNRDEVPPYLSDTVENRIFEAVETLVPVATSKAHDFQVMPGSENPTSIARAQNLDKVMARKYDTLGVQKKLEDICRKMLIYRFGVLKPGWDYEADDICVKEIDPRLIMVPRLRVDPHYLPYVIEIQGYSKAEMMDYFPDIDKEKLVMQDKKVETGETKEQKKEFQVFEVWTDSVVVWFHNNEVIKKEVNPYYDFVGSKVTNDEGKKETKFYNHFDDPQKPYIFFGTFNVSEGPLPPTSLVEIAIPIQDLINVGKRAIANNLKQMGNGQVYIDSDAMGEEEANNITNEPGLTIRGKNLASENKIRREPGVTLPNAHFANLQHSEVVFDNIMGVHSATRGAAAAKTLGQDIISRQQDFSRIDTITRELNRGVDRLANWLVQLMKLFYEEQHLVKIIGEEGAAEFVRLNRDDIEDYIEIIVKSGMNLPMDEVSLRNEAVQLWQLGAIDPTTLFERLNFPNPQRSAQRLLAWKMGQLTQETDARIREAEAGAQARASQGEGRGTEGVLDVLQRARQSLGGTTTPPAKKQSTKK